jgi:hypothetical protein
MGHALHAFAALTLTMNYMVFLGGGWYENQMFVFNAVF